MARAIAAGLDARGFAHEHGHTTLQEGIERVIAALYASPSVSFNVNNLEPALIAARKDLLGRRAHAAPSGLPGLNP